MFSNIRTGLQRLRTFTVGALILPLANFVGMRGAKPKQTLVCDLVRPDFLDLDRKPLYVPPHETI